MKDQITDSVECTEPALCTYRRHCLVINNFEGSSVQEVDRGPIGHCGTESAIRRPELSTGARASSGMIVRQFTIETCRKQPVSPFTYDGI